MGDKISKKKGGKKRYTGLKGGMKLSLAANLVLNGVCPVLSFPTLSTNHCCYVYCRYK